MEQMLKKALLGYSINLDSLIIEKELHKNSWHYDFHYKIIADGIPYSARLIPYNRSPNNVFGMMSDEILLEQIQFCEYLINCEIPFMKLVYTKVNTPFLILQWGDETYRFLIYEWIEGKHITHIDEEIAVKFGKFVRRIHDVSSSYTSSIFQKKSHLVGYKEFKETLYTKINTSSISLGALKTFNKYIEFAEYHLERAKSSDFDFIIQSDLNPLNIIWDEENNIIGLVDFESIGYGDRIEGLAWLIKWYSRTDGIHSLQMSAAVANAFLKSYNHDHFLLDLEKERLTSLIWLSGCLNWNFVKKTMEILESNSYENQMEEHLQAYLSRGENLLLLIDK